MWRVCLQFSLLQMVRTWEQQGQSGWGLGGARPFFSPDDERINGHNGFSVSYSGKMMQPLATKQASHPQCPCLTAISERNGEAATRSNAKIGPNVAI